MKEKRIYLFFLMLFFGITCSAQVFDFDTQWYYCQARFVNETERCSMAELKYIETKNDTMYGLYVDFDEEHEIKQFGKKVWFDGLKIYDFDLNVGDSLTIQNNNNSPDRYLIDSIQTKFIYGKTRIVQYAEDFVIIEGIGTSRNLSHNSFFFNQFELFYIADPARMLQYLKYDNELVALEPEACTACDALVTNLVHTETIKLNIYPNPVSDRLYLNGVSGENVAIYDQLGKLLVKQKLSEQNGIDVSSLLPGAYVLLIDDSMSTQFVKE